MRIGTCVHFTGIQHDSCEAKIRYQDIRGGVGLPCVNGNKAPSTCCAGYLDPTPEQVAEWEAKCAASMDRFRKAMPAVNEWRKAQAWSKRNRVSARGTVPCAACGTGTIHLSMAASNGHAWGRCTTAGCVSWVE